MAQAIELAPDSSLAWNKLGRVYRRVGMYDKAIECYNKALFLDPNDGHAYCNIGTVFLFQGDYNQACQYYERGMSLVDRNTDDEYPTLLANYALAIGQSGNIKWATTLINEAEQLGYEDAKTIKQSLGISSSTANANTASIIIERMQLIMGSLITILFGLFTLVCFTDAELAGDGFLPFCIVCVIVGILLMLGSRKRKHRRIGR